MACERSTHNIVTPECTMYGITPECFESLQFATLASMEVKDEDEEDEEMRVRWMKLHKLSL